MKHFLKKSFLMVLPLLFAVGCIKSKAERNISFDLSKSDYELMAGQCEEIESFGNILSLLGQVKSDTREIFRLLDGPNPEINEVHVSKLADGINEKSKKIITLSKEEWTKSIWPYEVAWRIDEEDFKGILGNYFRNGFELLDESIHSVYLMGEKRDDLKSGLILERNRNSLIVTFKGIGSSIELCQLQRTMSIILKVKFRSIRNIKKQYFNLNINSEFKRGL